MSKELAGALEASNSEEDLRRFEELMERDVEPEESYEEFSERYTPVSFDPSGSRKVSGLSSITISDALSVSGFGSTPPHLDINIVIEDDDESELIQ